MTRPDSPGRGIALMLGTMLLFALQDASAKFLVDRFDIVQINASRFAIATLFAISLARGRAISAILRPVRPWLQLVRGVLMMISTYLFVTALAYLPLATAHTLAFLAPLMVAGLAVPLLGERVGWRRWAAIGGGLIGVLVVLRPGIEALRPVALLPVLVAFLYALFQIATRIGARTEGTAVSMLHASLLGSLVFAVLLPFVWRTPEPIEAMLLVLIGLFGAGAQWLLIKALEAAPISVLAPFHYSQLLWSIFLGYLVFDTWPDLWVFAGAGIIIASGVYLAHRERVAAARTRQSARQAA
jgi:drug/metabolite transporter (DMT)-like permease